MTKHLKEVSHLSKDEYLDAVKRAEKDASTIAKTVDELVDVQMIDFCKFMEGKNKGELLTFRAMMEEKMLQMDLMGAEVLNSSNVTQFNKEERLKVGQIFTIVARIADKVSYIDYKLLGTVSK
jgi:hypothetical protein